MLLICILLISILSIRIFFVRIFFIRILPINKISIRILLIRMLFIYLLFIHILPLCIVFFRMVFFQLFIHKVCVRYFWSLYYSLSIFLVFLHYIQCKNIFFVLAIIHFRECYAVAYCNHRRTENDGLHSQNCYNWWRQKLSQKFLFQANRKGLVEDCQGLVIKTLYVPLRFKLYTQK